VARQREPGWYADPASPGQWRWWDGGSWTEHAVSADPKAEPVIPSGGAGEPGGAGEAGEGGAKEHVSGSGRRSSGGSPGDDEEAATLQVLTSTGPAAPPAPTAGTGPGPSTSTGTGTAAGDPATTEADATGDTAQLSAPGPGRRGSSGPGTGVFARRWAALVGVVVLVIVVLAIVLRGHSPALYWEGEPIGNASHALSEAQAAMRATASADEGVVSSQSSCYFSLPNRSAHDVAPYVRCGPVFLPWSSRADAWLTYRLSASPTSSGVKLSVASSSSPSAATVGLAQHEVLRRPGGGVPPAGEAGLSPPRVPRQRAGWTGVLKSPPGGLEPAPVGDLIVDWGRSYRLVAFGETGRVSSRLDPAGLRDAVNPPGSDYSAGTSGDSRPQAKLLLPAVGHVMAIAELALSPGEAAGPVPALANGPTGSTDDRPVMSVVAQGAAESFHFPAGAKGPSANLTLAASVPVGSSPVLSISDKGLVQEVSLSSGRVVTGPSVLSRLGTDEALNVTGHLPGVEVRVSHASLVWFGGSDGGTVPPDPDQAYLQVLASASPPQASFLPDSDFTLELPAGQVVAAHALPDSDRAAILMGFLVPASFSDGTVVVSAGGRSFPVAVNFP
jgi:Protein of unknown function (DUF2510)